MAKNQTKEEQSKAGETIASALSGTERYIERNNKWLVIGLVVVVVLISGYLAWRNFYQAPREQEAQRQIFPAQQLFEKDSFAIALNGDGNNLGFLQILDEYSGTKTANLAHYYAGICYRSLGDLGHAIERLKSFDGNDKMVTPVALGALGDCYCDKGDLAKAQEYYNKAASFTENQLTAPIFLMKSAAIYETNGDWANAITAYKAVKTQYPNSSAAREIDKYLARATEKAKKK